MQKKRYAFMLTITVVMAVLLMLTVSLCVQQTSKKMTQYSFDELGVTTKRLAADFYDTIDTDNNILSAMAELISVQSEDDEATIVQIMNSFDTDRSLISYVELLEPDNRILQQDGSWMDASGELDFAEEKEKGSYVSDRRQSLLDPEDKVFRNAVPVVKNGKTVAILYGVASLNEISKTYLNKLYGGEAIVILVDGTTGDILLDTWHRTLGNLSDLSDRKIVNGDTLGEIWENMRNGKSGSLSSISKTVGKQIFLHYEPVGVNKWSVAVGVSKEWALAGTRGCTEYLYLMALIVGLLLLAYMAVVVLCLVSNGRSIYRLSVTDQNTQLQNRRAYETYLEQNRDTLFESVGCIYIDANGLHEINNRFGHAEGDRMLQMVADCLKNQFPGKGLYRIGGDEFVVLLQNADEAECHEKMCRILAELNGQNYSISYGLGCRTQEKGLDALVREADEQMLANKRAYYAEKEQRVPR